MLEEPIGDVVCVARQRQGPVARGLFRAAESAERLDVEPPSTAGDRGWPGASSPRTSASMAISRALQRGSALFVRSDSLARGDRPRLAGRDALGDQGRPGGLSLYARNGARRVRPIMRACSPADGG